MGIAFESGPPYPSETDQGPADWSKDSFGLCLTKLRAECAATIRSVQEEFHRALTSRDAVLLSLTNQIVDFEVVVTNRDAIIVQVGMDILDIKSAPGPPPVQQPAAPRTALPTPPPRLADCQTPPHRPQ